MAKKTELEEKMEKMIESLNQSSDFFKSLKFNSKINENKKNTCYYCESERDGELVFWVETLKQDPRYFFAFKINEAEIQISSDKNLLEIVNNIFINCMKKKIIYVMFHSVLLSISYTTGSVIVTHWTETGVTLR